MTTDYVLAYVPRKMKQEGHGNNYVLSFRDLTLRNKETITVDAFGQYYYFVDGFSTALKIVSDTGVYDLLSDTVNEMQHEHTGKIQIINRETPMLHLQFIVVTPKNKIK